MPNVCGRILWGRKTAKNPPNIIPIVSQHNRHCSISLLSPKTSLRWRFCYLFIKLFYYVEVLARCTPFENKPISPNESWISCACPRLGFFSETGENMLKFAILFVDIFMSYLFIKVVSRLKKNSRIQSDFSWNIGRMNTGPSLGHSPIYPLHSGMNFGAWKYYNFSNTSTQAN